VRRQDDGSETVTKTLGPGEYFGEMSILEGRNSHSANIRAAAVSDLPVEVLKLSRADFEMGFMFDDSRAIEEARKASVVAADEAARAEARRFAEESLRTKLLGFIRMVSRKQLSTLKRGEAVFVAGDPADRFFIVARGLLAVDRQNLGPSVAHLKRMDSMQAVIKEGEGFGEWALIRNLSRAHTIYCASDECEVVSILGRDFLQLVEKSEVVRKSFKELQGSGARARPSIFVADRPKPAKAAKRRKLEMPTNAYK